uniref:Ig-like domain-containing protein n=1 Tax=Neogobius melanostomus TaxID=47308 RepID=A0A8C6TPU6_9GOBI
IQMLWFIRHSDQPEGDASVFKGDTATINCTFETSYSDPRLFWYKQENGGFPKYMLRRFKSGFSDNSPDFDKSRFDADLKENSVYLQIQDVRVSDSAVYYCALRPTVTGNTKTLNKNLCKGHTELKPPVVPLEPELINLTLFVLVLTFPPVWKSLKKVSNGDENEDENATKTRQKETKTLECDEKVTITVAGLSFQMRHYTVALKLRSF